MVQFFWCTKYILFGAVFVIPAILKNFIEKIKAIIESQKVPTLGLGCLTCISSLWGDFEFGYNVTLYAKNPDIFWHLPWHTCDFSICFPLKHSSNLSDFSKVEFLEFCISTPHIAKVMFFELNTCREEKILLNKILIENFLQVALPTSIQRLGRMRSGAVVEEVGERSSSVVENILEISSEVTRAPSLEETEGVSRRRTTVVAEL